MYISIGDNVNKIPEGKENAITLRELQRITGLRWNLYAIQKARQEGYHILSDDAETHFYRLDKKDFPKDRAKECVYPERRGCRNCLFSHDPTLYDGGCLLSTWAKKRAEARQPKA